MKCSLIIAAGLLAACTDAPLEEQDVVYSIDVATPPRAGAPSMADARCRGRCG